ATYAQRRGRCVISGRAHTTIPVTLWALMRPVHSYDPLVNIVEARVAVPVGSEAESIVGLSFHATIASKVSSSRFSLEKPIYKLDGVSDISQFPESLYAALEASSPAKRMARY